MMNFVADENETLVKRQKCSSYYNTIPGTPESQANAEEMEFSRRDKYITCGVVYLGNIALGCATNTYGPTLTSFQQKYGVDGPTISKVFTVLTATYMCGGLSGSFVYSKVNRQLSVVLLLGILSAMIFATPLCSTLTLYFTVAGIIGACAGFYDTAQLTWIPEMLQSECPPFVQCQHFFYGIGTMLPAFLMAPFLQDKGQSNLLIPYAINGTVLMAGMLAQFLCFVFIRYKVPPPEVTETSRPEITERSDTDELIPSSGLSKRRVKLMVLSCCFFGAYLGMESNVFQFFSKFAQNGDLHLTQSEAAYTMTGLTVAFAIGRGLGIFIVWKVKPQLILCANITLTLTANILLLGWAQSSITILWTTGITFGFGLSCTLASFIAFIERHMKFTNFVGSLITVSGSGVAGIYQLIVGHYIDSYPIVLSYVSFLSLSVILISFSSLSYLTYKRQ